ncbi:MAG: trimethylamine methyltransferase family protein [Desulfobacterales bacterium]|nr:trimethylamine methyltransferase family protein [Desulfobacterales bacterium]
MNPQKLNHNTFTVQDLDRIHDASMEILAKQGVIMDSEPVLDLFKNNGFKTDGSKVFFTEKQVLSAVESAPESFEIRARNPKKNLDLGKGIPVFCGTGGEIYIAEKDMTQRQGTMADYEKIAKLVQTSSINQMTAHESVHPHELKAATSHLDMMLKDLTLCDVAATSSTQDAHCLQDCLDMLAIVFGGIDELAKTPATLGIISPLSPLQYAPDQADALVVLAQNRQPAAITNMLLLGSSAPVSIPGALALGNAELLAGIVLSQIVRQGTPVIYGSTSCPLYMKNGASCLGSPETLIMSRGIAQLAAYYTLPCRTGGGLSDAHVLDGQAMAESALNLNNAINSGADYILHSFGMLSSYLATSLEKWVMDEEICRYILASRQKIEVTPETLDLETILSMGAQGNYLTHPSTFQNFRSLFQHELGNRDSHMVWSKNGSKDIVEQASALLEKRIEAYEQPQMDEGMAQELTAWVERRKNEINAEPKIA